MALQIARPKSNKVFISTAFIAAFSLVVQPLMGVSLEKTASALAAPSIVINEFSANGTLTDWVELYNTTDSAVDLVGWQLNDSGSKMEDLSGTLAPHKFLVVEVGSRLNQEKDGIKLLDDGDNVVDSLMYDTTGEILYPSAGRTTARVADGGEEWAVGVPTKGISNDVTPPNAEIIVPERDGMYVKGDVQVTGRVDEDAQSMKSHWFAIKGPDGGHDYEYDMDQQSSTWSFTWNTEDLEEGEYTLRYVATDKAGNRSDKNGNTIRRVIVDNTKPSITDKALSDLVINGKDEAPLLSANIKDNGGIVERVQYKITAADDTSETLIGWVDVSAEDGVFNSSIETINQAIDVSNLDDGDYELTIRAFDAAGNKKSGARITFGVDRSAPVITIDPQTDATSTTRTVTGTSSEESDILVTLDTGVSLTVTPSDGVWGATFTDLAEGHTYTVTASSTDAAGNQALTQTATFTVGPFVPGPAVEIPVVSPITTSSVLDQPTGLVTDDPTGVTVTPQSGETNVQDTDVLGTETTNEQELDLGQVAETPAVIAPSEEGWKIFGVAWYWWMVAAAALAGIVWRVVAVRRQKQLL